MDEMSAMATWGPIVFMVVLFYFFLYRPQKKQQQAQKDLLASLKPGQKAVTRGGIIGTLTEIYDNTVLLKVADGTEIEVVRSMIGNTLPDDLDTKTGKTIGQEQ